MRRAARYAALLALAATPAFAGPIADAGRDAEKFLTLGKIEDAAATLDKARDRLWRESPLAVKRAQFVAAEPQGFGVYEPRRGASFRAGEALYVYGEMSGYGYGRDGDRTRIEFEVTLSVAQAGGNTVIAPQSGKLALSSRAENKEYMLALVYEPKGLPAGEFTLQADLRDVNSGKTTTIRLPFKIL